MCSRNQAVDLLPAPSVSEVHPGMFAQKILDRPECESSQAELFVVLQGRQHAWILYLVRST